MTKDGLLAMLNGVKSHGKYDMAQCPAHDDHDASLKISVKDNGWLDMHCFAGCTQDSILGKLGIVNADLNLNNGHKPESTHSSNRKLAAIFHYEIETGKEAYAIERWNFDGGKDFKAKHLENGIYVPGQGGHPSILYNLPELPGWIAAGKDIYLPEGEGKAKRLIAEGFAATTPPYGANAPWRSEYGQALAGANVIIPPDNDDPGRAFALKKAASLYGIAKCVKVLELPGLPPKGDIIDWLNAGGTADQLQALTDACATWKPVEKVPLPLMTISGAELLDRIAEFIKQYVVLSRSQVIATALWILHTHDFEAADTTPYINVTSPEKRSGKTRLLEIFELLVKRPWLTGRVTPAVLARKIDKEAPTLLLDESDAAFNGEKEYAETLRGILNTGHRRGGKTSVCIGQGAKIDYKDLSTFCPKAIAGIGKLPDTVSDRSITIILKRRTASEPIERFRRKKVEPFAQVLRDSIVALVTTLNLKGAEPDLPLELDDRAADSWEPLLAIADAAGGDWPQRARSAAIDLSCGGVKDDQSLGTRLLADIKAIFTNKQADRLPSAEIVQELNALEDAPWVDLGHKPLTANKMARLLKPYGVTPGTMRMGLNTPKGYHRADFIDVWNRYAPPLSGILTATTDTLATSHVQNRTATISVNNKNVLDTKHEQLSYDVLDVADVAPDRASQKVNDDVDLDGPSEEPPWAPADDIVPDDLPDDDPFDDGCINLEDIIKHWNRAGCPADWQGEGTNNDCLDDLLKDSNTSRHILDLAIKWHAADKKLY